MCEGGCGKLTRVGVLGDERGFFGGEGGVKTLRATGLHTPYGVETPRADVSTWGSCSRGFGKDVRGCASGGRLEVAARLAA